jgi:hypothetical protein
MSLSQERDRWFEFRFPPAVSQTNFRIAPLTLWHFANGGWGRYIPQHRVVEHRLGQQLL